MQKTLHEIISKGDTLDFWTAVNCEHVEQTRRVNEQDTSNGFTPLHIAIAENSQQFFHRLLKFNIDISLVDKQQRTPLHLGCCLGREGMVKELLKISCPKHREQQDALGCTPLMIACAVKKMNLIEEMINNYGVNVNAQDHAKCTALHITVLKNDIKTTKFLLDNNANINLANMNKFTAVHLAVAQGYYNILELLLQYNPDLSLKTCSGYTPLQLAENRKDEDMVVLIKQYIKENKSVTQKIIEIVKPNPNPIKWIPLKRVVGENYVELDEIDQILEDEMHPPAKCPLALKKNSVCLIM